MDLFPDIRIIGSGRDFPPVLSNDELYDSCNMDIFVTREWMDEKIKIEQRHSSLARPIEPSALRPAEGYLNSDLATRAIQKAVERARDVIPGVESIEAVFYSSCTPDQPVPPTSAIILDKLGLNDVFCIDIRSACSGSTMGISSALQYLRTHTFKCVAVVGSETGSLYANLSFEKPYSTKGDAVNACMIGDGAAAVLLYRFDGDEVPIGHEIRYIKTGCIGRGREPGMSLLGGGCRHPINEASLRKGLQYFKHDFKSVLSHGPQLYLKGLEELQRASGLTFADLDLIVPHQANGSVPDIASRMGLPTARIHSHFTHIGNTANASLLIALDIEQEQNRLQEGAQVAFLAAESTKWLYGVFLLTWHPRTPHTRPLLARPTASWALRLYSASLIKVASFLLWIKNKLL